MGALASVYGKEDGGADTAVWLTGDTELPSSNSVAHRTIMALRELGVLDDIMATTEGFGGVSGRDEFRRVRNNMSLFGLEVDGQ